jgi:hypothetical protein
MFGILIIYPIDSSAIAFEEQLGGDRKLGLN